VRRPKTAGIRVGLISDTHGLLRPEAIDFLAGSQRLVHAGDIGDPRVLEGLESIATLDAIRGNNDTDAWAANIPQSRRLEIGGAHLLVLHDRADLTGCAAPAGTHVVIVGHSHKPMVEIRQGVLFVNPGSAGPRRFKLPVAAGELRIEGRAVRATLVDLLTRQPLSGMSATLVI
jgi:uncharacterized protein